MPELPEVETIARGLSSRVMGDVIESVWLGSKPEPLKSPAVEIVRTLESRRITAVRRVGKHIVFDLELADGVGRAPSPARRRHKTRSLPSPKKAAGGGARPTRALRPRVLAGVLDVFHVSHRNNNVLILYHRMVGRIHLQV